jgi:excisionase family DNA binding protein
VSDGSSRSDRLQPERIRLGEASRLLGVDPDTLRRWADEGRVQAFTTPGGHRRFDRRALDRLVSTRRTGPAGQLAGLGDSSTRLSAAYRRRYGELHGGGSELHALVPAHERAVFRQHGQQLVDALVRHLDRVGPERGRAEREAMELTALMGDRLARLGVALEVAVSMFVAARRPFLTELGVVARRRGVDAVRVGRLYEASSGLLDRLLLAFVAAHTEARDDDAGVDDALGVGVPGEQAREVGGEARRAEGPDSPVGSRSSRAGAGGADRRPVATRGVVR